jgi:ribonuclease D
MQHVSQRRPEERRFYTQVTDPMLEARLIQDFDALETAVFRLRGADRLAIDTEFMRERTYHPQLCLVQVGTETDCFLVDPLAEFDLAPLHALLADRSKLKILHAARQDLEVLLLSGGSVPGPLFDTQVAAAFLGFPPQMGYADLVARQLGHSIDKGQTRTDWSRRPLTAAQLAYAADDVKHLLTLQTELQTALVAKGRARWVADEVAALENPALYRTDPAQSWRRLKGLNRLRPVEQSAARALAEWRERRALESDRPRGWILADEALYGLAVREPVSIEALESVPALPPGVLRKRGDELLGLLRTARADLSTAPLLAPKRPEPEQMALATRLLQVVRNVATELELGAEVLATRKDVEAVAYGSVALQDSPLARGWRGEALAPRLSLALLERAEIGTLPDSEIG